MLGTYPLSTLPLSTLEVVETVVIEPSGGVWHAPYREYRWLDVTARASSSSILTGTASVTVSRSLETASLTFTVRTNSVQIDKLTARLLIELAATSLGASVQLHRANVTFHRLTTVDTVAVTVTLGTAATSASRVLTVNGNALTITTGGGRAMITTVTPITRKAAKQLRETRRDVMRANRDEMQRLRELYRRPTRGRGLRRNLLKLYDRT